MSKPICGVLISNKLINHQPPSSWILFFAAPCIGSQQFARPEYAAG
jgi:hypothetical protein